MTIKVPFTKTITSHGLLIQVEGSVVGAISNWEPKQNRTATPVFEFGSSTVGEGGDIDAEPGEPYEIVPGNIGGTEISIRRYDIYSERFETAFKTKNLMMLTRQDKPIILHEYWASPEGTLNFAYIYYGVWFTSIGRSHQTTGDRIVMANAGLMYTRRREV